MPETRQETRQDNVNVYRHGVAEPICWWTCGDCGVQSAFSADVEMVERWANHHRCGPYRLRDAIVGASV